MPFAFITMITLERILGSTENFATDIQSVDNPSCKFKVIFVLYCIFKYLNVCTIIIRY